WDVRGDRLTKIFGGTFRDRSQSSLGSFALTPDAKSLITTHPNGAIRFWDVTDRKLVERRPLAIQPFRGSMAFNGRHLLTQNESLTTTIELWDLAGSVPLPVADPDGLIVESNRWPTFSPD